MHYREGGPAIADIDLMFMKKNGLISDNVQKKTFKKLTFKVLTSISCVLKALYRFT